MIKKLALLLLLVIVFTLYFDLRKTWPQEALHPSPEVQAESLFFPLVYKKAEEAKTPETPPAPFELAPGEFLTDAELVLNPFTGEEELPPSHEMGLAPGEFWAEGREWVFRPTPIPQPQTARVPTGGSLEEYQDFGVKKEPPEGCTWIKAKYSHYWPPWGPPNCADFRDNYCYSKTSSTRPWGELTGYGVAMPMPYEFGTLVYFAGQEWQVWDRGSLIVMEDGMPLIDFMTTISHLPHKSVIDVCIIQS